MGKGTEVHHSGDVAVEMAKLAELSGQMVVQQPAATKCEALALVLLIGSLAQAGLVPVL